MSLHQRLLLCSAILLLLFCGLITLALEKAFHQNTLDARQRLLQSQSYLLLAALEVNHQGQIQLPDNLPEPRLQLPQSGLYAQIIDPQGKVLWHSPSLVKPLPASPHLPPGQQKTQQTPQLLIHSMGLDWQLPDQDYRFTLQLAEHLLPFQQQIADYRADLWRWLGGLSALLLASLLLILRWGLRPLQQLGSEIGDIEAGQQQQLNGRYPKEIQPLTLHLNRFIQAQQQQQQRYRNALGDLAHSLKTPLAVMRNALEQQQTDECEQQLRHMDSLLQYQLQRAATAGRSNPLTPALAIHPISEQIINALNKVYRDKSILFDNRLPADLSYPIDRGDLMELLGNLLDNACKWCHHQITLSADHQANRLILNILDDGPGIAPEQHQQLLQRGKRADESVPGHGIGLAIVLDIVQACQGELKIDTPPQGGCQMQLWLPR